MATAGKWMFFIGLILGLVALGVVIWGGTQVVQATDALTQDTITVEGETTVPMQSQSMRFIIAEGNDTPVCTVTAADGTNVPVGSDEVISDLASDETGQIIGTITADEAGDYTVACTGGTVTVSGSLGSSVLIGAVAAGLGLVALLPLGLLTLIGLILWLVGRSRNKRADQDAGGYGYSTSTGSGYVDGPGYVDGQGYGNAPGYGPPPSSPSSPSTSDPYAPPPPPPGYGPGAGGSEDPAGGSRG